MNLYIRLCFKSRYYSSNSINEGFYSRFQHGALVSSVQAPKQFVANGIEEREIIELNGFD